MTQKECEEGTSHTLLTVRFITNQHHSLLSIIPLSIYLSVSIMHFFTCCLTNEKSPQSTVLSCHFCFLYRPINQSNPRVLRSLWITSFHMVLGLPRFRFPWVGFQRYNVIGILPGSICNTWPNHLSRRFLIMFVSWGCLVRDLT